MRYLNPPEMLPDNKINAVGKIQVSYQPLSGVVWYDKTLYSPECFVHIQNIYDNIMNAFGKIDVDLYDMEKLITSIDGAVDFLLQMRNEICTFIYKNCHARIPTIDKSHAYLMRGLCKWQNIYAGMPEDEDEGDSIYLQGTWFKIVDGDFNRSMRLVACEELHNIYDATTDSFQRELGKHHGIRIDSLPKFLMSCSPHGMSDILYDMCSTCIDERVQNLMACIEIDSTKTLVHQVLHNVQMDIKEATRPCIIMKKRSRIA